MAEGEASDRSAGILVFTLWYIAIAINYYMGWLPWPGDLHTQESLEAAIADHTVQAAQEAQAALAAQAPSKPLPPSVVKDKPPV